MIAPSLGSRLREHHPRLRIKKRFVNTQIWVLRPVLPYAWSQSLPPSTIVIGMISQNHRNILQDAAT
jgi:hypothetical protein